MGPNDMSTAGGAVAVMLLLYSVISLGLFVWYLWSMARLLGRLGFPDWHGWIPIWNEWQLLVRGGFPGWIVLLGLIPFGNIVWVIVRIMAVHRINVEHGKGVGYTVMGALIAPLWATLLGTAIGPQGQMPSAGPAQGGAYGGSPFAPPPPAPAPGSAPAGYGAGPGYGAGSEYGAPQYGAAPYGQNAPYGQPGQAGQPAAYGQPGQQVFHGQAGQQNQYGQASQSPAPAPAQSHNPFAPPPTGTPSAGDHSSATPQGFSAPPPPQPGPPGQPGHPQGGAPSGATGTTGQTPWETLLQPPSGDDRSSGQPSVQGQQNSGQYQQSQQNPGQQLPVNDPNHPNYHVDPTPTNTWGLSSTTEREFNRLAAEGLQQPPSTPLAPQAPQRSFEWPAGASNSGQGSGVGLPPVPPEALSSEPGRSSADSQPTDAQAERERAEREQAAEPTIFDDAPPIHPAAAVADEETSTESSLEEIFGRPREEEPPVEWLSGTVTRVPSKPGANAGADAAADAVDADGADDDLDRTVVVSRPMRQKWVLELPDGHVIELPGSDVIIGRKPEPVVGVSIVAVPDPSRTLSKSHARLRFTGNQWTIEDLGSTNGVALIHPNGSEEELAPHSATTATEQLFIGTLQVSLRRAESTTR